MICCCAPSEEELFVEPQRALDAVEEPTPVAQAQLVARGSQAAFAAIKSSAASFRFDKDQCYVFTVGVHRSTGDTFGLDLSAAGRLCLVNAVSEGSLVAEWNRMWLAKGDKEQTVQQFDRVVALNTDRPSKGKQIMDKLRKCIGPVAIVMQRPVTRKVRINKTPGQDLGITIVDGYRFLIVASIAEGVFRDHNSGADPDEIIQLPSLFMSVNGQRGSGSELMKFMQDSPGAFEVELLFYD